ncbi:MAG: hypothetical protein FWC26_04445 [Fibromonadales bacterium]|nr:hypothetical protein [Fibromonadales bacterium]
MKNVGVDSLLDDLFAVMPNNMADFNNSHQKRIKQLLKIDNDDLHPKQVKFAPRHRREMELA